jgi:hypothetical protein
MPVSDIEGKAWIKGTLRDLELPFAIEHVWDLGAGAGTYLELLWYDFCGSDWVAVEVWQPYIEQYGLSHQYDRVIPSDIMSIEFPKLRDNGMVILGDVLEHLQERDAYALVEYLKDRFAVIILSLPIVHSPQGEVNGNPYEAHLKHWSFEEAKELLDGTKYDFKGHTIGAFVWVRSEHR